jgi:hypothetical protein
MLVEYEGELMTPLEKARRVSGKIWQATFSGTLV